MNALSDAGDDAEIVGDEQRSRPGLFGDVLEEPEDLGLDGDIEGAGGSSASKTIGLHDTAMASITRCRMPPEN